MSSVTIPLELTPELLKKISLAAELSGCTTINHFIERAVLTKVMHTQDEELGRIKGIVAAHAVELAKTADWLYRLSEKLLDDVEPEEVDSEEEETDDDDEVGEDNDLAPEDQVKHSCAYD